MKLCCVFAFVFVSFHFILHRERAKVIEKMFTTWNVLPPNRKPPDSLNIRLKNEGFLSHLGSLCEIHWNVHSPREFFVSWMNTDDGESTKHHGKNCTQFPSDWDPRVEMMKKFNLMFNSNSHPFFISVFPAHSAKDGHSFFHLYDYGI